MVKRKKKNLTPEEEKQIKLEKLKKSWDAANEELSLEGMSTIQQVHTLVDTCDTLMCEICQLSDKIKIDDLTKAQELTPIDKSTYMEFVKICVLKNNAKLKDKAIAKFEEDFAKKLFITNLRHSFLESYMNGDNLKITNEENEDYVPFEDYQSDEFNEIMQNSAKIREYLNTILWPKYKTYAKAAEFITNLELTYKDFKNLVDWQHYKDGGYPTENTPSKIWSVYNRFNYCHRLLNKYEYNDVANDLTEEFGLEIEEKEPNPVDHPWDKAE